MVILRYGKSEPARAQLRSPSISGVMPIHPIGSMTAQELSTPLEKDGFPIAPRKLPGQPHKIRANRFDKSHPGTTSPHNPN